MRKTIIVLSMMFSSGFAAAQDATVLTFTNQATGKTFMAAVADGGQAFVSDQNGGSFVVVPARGELRVYRPSTAGVALGKRGAPVPMDEADLLQSAPVINGQASLDLVGLDVMVAKMPMAEVLLEQTQTMERQEIELLASGRPITFVDTAGTENHASQ